MSALVYSLDDRGSIFEAMVGVQQKRRTMEFQELLDAIDHVLANEPKLDECERSYTAAGSVWSRNDEVAEITPSGSTGMALTLSSGGRLIHARIFARSPMSIERLARAIAEHLTGYAS